MITLTFSEFYRGDYRDQGFELYIVKDSEEKIMYIRISRDTIWYRWFGGVNSHMMPGLNVSLRGNSIIGEVIARRFPDSWDWHIELWTKEDCIVGFRDDLIGLTLDNITIEQIESYLIQRFLPLYNVMHAGGSHEDPLLTHSLDNAYKKIFGSDEPMQ